MRSWDDHAALAVHSYRINHLTVAEQSSHNCQRKHRPKYHIHTYIRQWLLLTSRVINIHHCKNVTPTIISIQKSTRTYIHTYIHTLEYMMYLVSGYQPQRRPETAPSWNTEPIILTCRYKSQNYFNASACTVCMYVRTYVCTYVCMCMYVLYVCMYLCTVLYVFSPSLVCPCNRFT